MPELGQKTPDTNERVGFKNPTNEIITRNGGGDNPAETPAEKPKEKAEEPVEAKVKSTGVDMDDRNARIQDYVKTNREQIPATDESSAAINDLVLTMSGSKTATFDDFRAKFLDIRDKFGQKKEVSTPLPNGSVLNIMTSKNERQYSFLRGIQSMLKNPGKVPTGFEGEVNQELRSKATPCGSEGMIIPKEFFEGSNNQMTEKDVEAFLSSRNFTAADGGAPISLDTPMPSQYVKPFRLARLLDSLKMTNLDNLPTNVSIPVGTGDATADWYGEGGETQESEPEFKNFMLSPKRLSASTAFTTEAILQSIISLETEIKDSLAYAMNRRLTETVFTGTGNDQPRGILNTVGKTGFPEAGRANGGIFGYQNLSTLEKLLNEKNIPMDDDARTLVANFSMKSYWELQLKFPGSTSSASGPILNYDGAGRMGMVKGMKTLFTNYLPNDNTKGDGEDLSSLVYGYWRDFVMASWNTMQIVVDPYTKAKTAETIITCHAFYDFGIKRPESFVYVDDIIAIANNS